MIDGLVSEKPVKHGPRQRLRSLYHCFQAIIADAVAGRDRAAAAFTQEGGDRLLGRRAQS